MVSSSMSFGAIIRRLDAEVEAMSAEEWATELRTLAARYESGEILLGYTEGEDLCMYSDPSEPQRMCGVGALMTEGERKSLHGCREGVAWVLGTRTHMNTWALPKSRLQRLQELHDRAARLGPEVVASRLRTYAAQVEA